MDDDKDPTEEVTGEETKRKKSPSEDEGKNAREEEQKRRKSSAAETEAKDEEASSTASKSNLDYIAQIKAIVPEIPDDIEYYGEGYDNEEYYGEDTGADSSSVESLEFKTASGQIIKMYRKKKKKEEPEKEVEKEPVKQMILNMNELKEKVSATDVQLDGWMSKGEFKILKLADMKSIVRQVEEMAKFNAEEAKLFEHTLYRIEIREREIHSRQPMFDYQFPWKGAEEMEHGPRICKTDPPTPVEPYLTPKTSDGEQEEDANEIKKDEMDEFYDELKEIRKKNSGYIPVNLTKEFQSSTDSFYDDMTIEGKKAAEKYIRGIGELAPDNFDVMRYNYGKLVNGVDDETQINVEKFNHANVMYPRDCNFKSVLKMVKKTIRDRREYFNKLKVRDEKTGDNFMDKFKLPDFIDPATGMTKTASTLALEESKKKPPFKVYKDPKKFLADKELEDRLFRINEIPLEFTKDEEKLIGFLAFQISNAKFLPISEKLRYALMEEMEMKIEFQDFDTQALRRENDVKMYIDMECDVVNFMTKYHEELKHVVRCGRHDLSNNIKAEKIVIFSNKLLKQMLSLESKVMITYLELNKVKRKVDLEYKRNYEYGESIQVIDFEWLRISNSNFIEDYEEQNVQLNGLKLITGRCFEVLKEWRTALEATEREFSRIDDDKNTRRGLNYSFKMNTKRCKAAINELSHHNDFLRRRLRIFKAPSTLEYVKLQALQNSIRDEIELLKAKMESVNLSLSHGRKTFKRYKGTMPQFKKVQEQNKAWLKELRSELETQGLNRITNEMHDADERRIRQCMDDIRSKKEEMKMKAKHSLFRPAPKNPLKVALDNKKEANRLKKERIKEGSNLNTKLANIEKKDNKYKRKQTLHALSTIN